VDILNCANEGKCKYCREVDIWREEEWDIVDKSGLSITIICGYMMNH
jgi:hypothetical protein